ncbi:RagB/SusD family nutrient uptake outer membrane protein [Mucilaginibacter ginsenosidivorax]|uniref:RagB/SusD family nutrient uptake outer membrane protein n=1 Tax=Mucilaginibacter ginsenosidivorax TaxID=862126 RepID=A0A5B8VUF4_9SPHI|nr:RagB/SusD family nutrient uptake outer membrane protein [Mucilaginibacter ginsenosidivorax]QEC75217.1 RagB/SusD family nutrient uptake outer membrane protein [Mucilaginibacter ginsenosidivorax]
MKKYKLYIGGVLLSAMLTGSCTKLDEHVYDKVDAASFLSRRDDVIRDFLRPFEHAYWSIQGNDVYAASEDCTDEIGTYNRQGDWQDGGYYQRMHYHTWTITDGFTSGAWTNFYQGIVLATNSLTDMEGIKDPSKLSVTDAELTDFKAELHTLRAWFYLRAFDFYRNIEIVTDVKTATHGNPQSSPQEIFSYIESELKSAIDGLPTRQQLGAPGIGRWTKAGAAALLARLYLNAKVYIGTDKYAECEAICRDIIGGKYGAYQLDTRWDAPFDYTNTTLNSEVIYGFPGSLARTHWQYDGGMFFWGMTYDAAPLYCGFTDFSQSNPRYALQPGRDVDSVEYTFQLGKPFVKFQKYPDDLRLKKYKNLGNSTREGMFLFGYLPYTHLVNGVSRTDTVKGNKGPYPLFIRDQVGMFLGAKPGIKIADKESDMNHADHNSGVFLVKYPFYPTPDPNRITSAYAEIRLSEIYYTLAECRYRAGDKAGAAGYLNQVRRRNYPDGSSSLYKSDGSQLTDQEMLDEWGREFIGENRRRTDLIRWGVFNTGTWWDKKADGDKHTEIFPIGRDIMNVNPQFKQNPGY